VTTSRSLRIATRGSRLAQAQATWVAAALRHRHPGLHVEINIVRTRGDQLIDAPLSQIAGKGAFTREIERALLDDEADLAVHSLKDLPTEQPSGLRLAASPPREDPHDVLIGPRPLDWRTLHGGAVIGTSSLRRQAQLLHRNPRLTILPIRGNVPTRIRKALEGECAAVILAQAGVNRLELRPPFLEVIDFADMLPAPGQGALGLQVRDDDREIAALVEALDDPETSIACRAERGFLHALGGGCRVPIAALALVEGNTLWLEGMVSSIDGKRFFRDRIEGESRDPEGLGAALAESLARRGANEVLRELAEQPTEIGSAPAPARPQTPAFELHVDQSFTLADLAAALGLDMESEEETRPLRGALVIVTRDEDVDGPLSRALLARGAEVVCLPLIEHLPPINSQPLDQAARDLDTFEWIVFTSARAVDALLAALSAAGQRLADYTGRIACVGPATAQRVEAAGGSATLTPKEAKGDALAAAFNDAVRRGLIRPGSQVLFPRADRAGTVVQEALLECGAIVHDVEAYRTVASRRAAAELVRLLEENSCRAITFASGSAAEALLEILDVEDLQRLSRNCVIATIGPSTSEPLRRHGIVPAVEAAKHTFEGLADTLAQHIAKGAAQKKKR